MKTFRVLLALPLLLAFAGATTVIPMSVEEMTQAAARVVEVEVAESWSAWNADRSLIYTYSRVRIARALKGGVEPEMVVQQLGGSAGGYTMKVAGVNALERGEHAVLFLRPTPSNGGGTWSIVGLMQGHFRMRTSGPRVLLSNGLSVKTAQSQSQEVVSSFAAPGSAAAVSGVQSLTLEELETRVRRALQQ